MIRTSAILTVTEILYQLRNFILSFGLGFAVFGSNQLLAAYRVYQLKVIHYDERNRPAQRGTVITTLDPYQFEHYQGEFGRVRVQMVDTWYCPGDTSRQTYCKKPKDKNLQRGPAGIFAPKREPFPYKLAPVIP